MEVPRRVVRRGLARPNGVVLVLSLLLAAAVSTKPVVTPRPLPSNALGACSAVTADDLERALGRRFGRGQEESHGAESTCDAGAGTQLHVIRDDGDYVMVSILGFGDAAAVSAAAERVARAALGRI